MAEAVEQLISSGHGAGVWDYTPRQISGFLTLAAGRKKREAADQLSLQALASRGDPKELQRQHKELMKA